MWYVGNAGKNVITYIYKTDMDEFINVSHVFIKDISRYIGTSCDLKNKRNKKFFILVFLFFHRPRLAPDLKAEDCFK